jgi:CarD family transcriptional regulator
MSKKKRSAGIFKVGEHAIYPLHGVAFISDISDIVVATQEIECIRLEFERKKMSLYLPLKKLESLGLRTLVKSTEANKIIEKMKETSKFLRVIWNRRSKEYESKIQSGDILACAEVVRELYKNTNNPNRSYTEAIIYEEALYRVVSELSIVQKRDYSEVEAEINNILSKYHETYQSLNNMLDDIEEIVEEPLEDYKNVANG